MQQAIQVNLSTKILLHLDCYHFGTLSLLNEEITKSCVKLNYKRKKRCRKWLLDSLGGDISLEYMEKNFVAKVIVLIKLFSPFGKEVVEIY